jgi:hypothetical protein
MDAPALSPRMTCGKIITPLTLYHSMNTLPFPRFRLCVHMHEVGSVGSTSLKQHIDMS